MPLDVTVPELGESITEVQVSAWLKQPGESVALDEPFIELETDKATVEVPAPAAGVVTEFVVGVGEEAKVGDVLARIDTDAAADAVSAVDGATPPADETKKVSGEQEQRIMPAARRALAERGSDAAGIVGSGPGGRVLKEDVFAADAAESAKPEPPAPPTAPGGERRERVEKMSPIRRKIAERLVQSQQTAALLTTFNEIDMSRVKTLRAEHQEAFVARYGVKLGFMSFFVGAAVEALQKEPNLNAQVRGQEIVRHDYCDIGIAVGGGKGLVVPVVRNAESLDFGGIERTIADFAARAQANKITLDELAGGTFTISNGGVYGSLMSTPIINPPQSGVLGLHAIEDRPVVVDGEIVVRPMMYVALTYDHRLVDGREAVTFLKHIKDCVERPERLLLKV